jgi:hypothetical protein
MDRLSDSYFQANRPYQDQDVIRELDKNNKLSEAYNQDFNRVMDVMEKSLITGSESMQKASQQLTKHLEEQTELDREER